MISLGEDLNIIHIVPKMCYFEKKSNRTEVKITIDKMKGDLVKFMEDDNFHLKKNIFWQLDIAFQVIGALKKIH